MNKLLIILLFSWFLPSLEVEKDKDNSERPKVAICSDVDESYKSAAAVTAIGGNWSSPSTWSTNQLPGPSDQVTIPDNITVTLDVPSITVFQLTINGTLFVNRNQDINLTSNWILVNGTSALLDWGTAADPYLGNAVITLNGNDEAYNFLQMLGNKFLGVMGGATLQMHGETKRSWTKIDQKADIGATSIHLLDSVEWEVNDQIVIASTDFDPHEAEKRTITSISPDGRTLTLDTGLDYMHWGTLQSYKNGAYSLDERAEVGLLTRNIRIQGNTNSATTQFGGHVMIMASSKAYVAGVHFYRMGQIGKLGRYPFHWHLCRNVNGQYIKNSTIEKSWNRAVTVHGTDNALVEDNVAYDHIGHGYFLEDASETGTKFIGNLGLVSRVPTPPNVIENHDVVIRAGRHLSPATFWITNNETLLEGNVAAGSEGTGFWFITPEHDFAGYDTTKVLFDQPFTKFDNNVAHSNLALGVAFNGEFDVNNSVDPLNTTKTEAPNPHFYNNLIYKNEGNGLWTLTRAAVYENFIFADNGASTFHVFHQTFKNNLFVGRSDNYGTLVGAEDNALGYNLPDDLIIQRKARFNAFAFYDGPLGLEDCHFDGFNDEYSQIMQILGAAVVSSSNYSRDITFGPDVSTDNILSFLATGRDGFRGTNHTDERNTTIFNDLDNSMTGKIGAYSVKIVPPNAIYPYDQDYFRQPNATPEPIWDAWYNPTAKFGIIESKGVTIPDKETNIYTTRNKNGTKFTTTLEEASKANGNHWKILTIMDDGYSYVIQPSEVSKSQRFMKLSNVGYGEYVDVDIINIPNEVDVVEYEDEDDITTNNIPFGPFPSLFALRSQTSETGYYIKDNTMHLRYVASKANNVYGGSYRTAESELFNIIWTDALAQAWYDKKEIPIAEFNETEIDSRGSLHTNGDLQISPITVSGNNQFNVFSVYNDNDSNTEFTDYRLDITPQVWTGMPTLNINFAGNWQPQVFIKDGTTFHYLGLLNNGDNALSLAGKSTKLWEVNQIIIRFWEDRKIGNGPSPTLINLHEITLGTGQGDSDGDGTTDEDELTDCRDPNNAADLEFDFNENDLLWFKRNITDENFTSREDWVMRVDYEADPQIFRHDLDFPGSAFSQIHVRFKCQGAGNAEFFWATAQDTTFHASRSVSYNYQSTTEEWVVAVFDMSGHPDWNGETITKLRFDMPSDSTKRLHTTIDYIRSENATFATIEVANAPCLGDLVEFSATINSNDPSDTYQWQYKDADKNWNDIAGATSLLYSSSNNIDKLHRIKIERNGCEQVSSPLEVELVASPAVTLPVEDVNLCSMGDLYSLEASPEGGFWTDASPNGEIVGDPIYINVGGPAASIRGIDWIADTYNNGGTTYSYPSTTPVGNTVFDPIYHTERWNGGTLQYDIPVTNAEYTVQLHFAELWPTAHNNGVRVFDIEIEGNTVQASFDIFATSGANSASIVTYRTNVVDGSIDIDLLGVAQNPKLNGISILPRSFDPNSSFTGLGSVYYEYIDPTTGCLSEAKGLSIYTFDTPEPTVPANQTVCERGPALSLSASPDGGEWSGTGIVGAPIHINAGGPTVTEGGRTWLSDQYFTNGNAYTTNYNTGGTASKPIYQSERWFGGDLAYEIPVPDGDYQVRLYFSETRPPLQSNGARVFSIELEGTTVETNFDIFAEVGGNQAIRKTYDISVTDGVINLDLLKNIENPKVSAISIFPLSFDRTGAGPGNHTLTYKYIDPVTGCDRSKSVTYTVGAAPVVTTSGNTSTCLGESVSLMGTASGNGTTEYRWYQSGVSGFISQQQNLSVNPTQTTSYRLIAIVDGCWSYPSPWVQVTVNQASTPTVSAPQTVCERATPVTLTATPTGGVWMGSGIITGNKFYATNAGAGTHTLTYEYTDANGCEGSNTTDFTVDAAPVATAAGTTSICAGREGTLTASATGTGTKTYNWYIAGTNTLVHQGQTFVVSPTQTTSYDILANVDGCLSYRSTAVTVSVNPNNAICFEAKSLLEGPFSGSNMGDALKEGGYLPLVEPYSSLGQAINNPGVSVSSAAIFNGAGTQDDIVDWVLVQLRDKNDPSLIVHSEAMLLDQNGQIFAYANGRKFDVLSFPVAHDSYYLAIFHRNHLPVMSANPLVFDGVSSLIDFRLSSMATYGTGARIQLATGLWGHITGDADNSNAVDAADRSSTWNSRNQSGYMLPDVTLDGNVDAADRSKTWNNRNRTGIIGQ